ncbi:MAG: hypothetical protein COW72_02650 [Candidatus Nealsonbacteria bacterium CG18_big_fil_WC_8_21_14_2_50_37_10]|uniref:Uncharacterized protein n=1 Tax=Candidatus Nealsonbacteria bacterium CG18_big_fil_WC_8_21_14_2_50_37_10 TaxID=1974717 RepID=A0A2H0FHW4_9BACT|nr:MAG: hypothetical protein COW72_02650 [Candidatus Nealsonbacteria bacterium CG18_big_fil_WC_8_21_14_2_50_37_10]
MKEKKVLDKLVKELIILEKKKARILQEVEELTKKPKADPKKVQSPVKRTKKLIERFQKKLEVIEKMASKI